VRAQSCHAPALITSRGLGLRAALETQVASYDNARYRGEYQGVAASAAWTYQPLQLYVRVPWFRVVRNGVGESGVGDVNATLRVELAKSADQALRAGLAVATSLPTGNAQRDLGMGHVMLTPGAFFALRHGETSTELLLAYGRALAHGGAHQHHARGLAPIVGPMNASEMQLAVAALRRIQPLFSLAIGAFAAVPVAANDGDGSARAFATAGLRLHRAWFEAAFDGAIPLVGDPFVLRTGLTLAANF
jgi:hypothetical protein